MVALQILFGFVKPTCLNTKSVLVRFGFSVESEFLLIQTSSFLFLLGV